MSCTYRRKVAVNHHFFTKLTVTIMLPMFDLIQILNRLVLDYIILINEKSKELCAYPIILHVLKIDRVHGYCFYWY